MNGFRIQDISKDYDIENEHDVRVEGKHEENGDGEGDDKVTSLEVLEGKIGN